MPINILDEFSSFFVENYRTILISLALALAALILDVVISRIIGKLGYLIRLDDAQIKSVRTTKRILIIVIAGSAILFQFWVEYQWIAGILSVALGTIIGFASINTIGNAIAGIIIMASRPFRVGDIVEIENTFGKISEISLIYTRIKTPANELISIPNQNLLTKHISNHSAYPESLISIDVSMTYDSSRKEVEKALMQAALDTVGVLNDLSVRIGQL